MDMAFKSIFIMSVESSLGVHHREEAITKRILTL